MKKQFFLNMSLIFIVLLMYSCSSETNSSNTYSQNGTYSVPGGSYRNITVTINGDKWTYLSDNKTESGIVDGRYLFDKHKINKYGEIYSDGTINFKGFELKK